MITSTQPPGASTELMAQVRDAIESAVRRNPAKCVLLSGGLDTSIVASLASPQNELTAYTVALKDAPSPDVDYARLIARKLGLDHNLHVFDMDELMTTLPEVIRALRVFDPMEIRNSAAVYIGLEQAKNDGHSAFLTGDACDELFAGYSFLFDLDAQSLRTSLKRLWDVMSFSAIPMGQSLDMTALIPFLDTEVRQLAEEIDPSFLVAERNGVKWGKWIVRKAFEDLLPSEITWRVKTPIEYGCGTTTLPQIFDKKIHDNEFRGKQRRIQTNDGVTIRDKEQLAYYEIFRETLGKRPATQGRTCPQCQYEVPMYASFCRTCGAYPI